MPPAPASLGKGLQVKIRFHQLASRSSIERQLQGIARGDERGLGNSPEVLLPAHQGAKPGVFQLSGAPAGTDGGALTWEFLVHG
jgi:hypothetical protein